MLYLFFTFNLLFFFKHHLFSGIFYALGFVVFIFNLLYLFIYLTALFSSFNLLYLFFLKRLILTEFIIIIYSFFTFNLSFN